MHVPESTVKVVRHTPGLWKSQKARVLQLAEAAGLGEAAGMRVRKAGSSPVFQTGSE